jgi:hypothetical protein
MIDMIKIWVKMFPLFYIWNNPETSYDSFPFFTLLATKKSRKRIEMVSFVKKTKEWEITDLLDQDMVNLSKNVWSEGSKTHKMKKGYEL